MKKNKVVSIILKIIAIIIILIGIKVFVEYRLWKETSSNFSAYLKTFLPISVLGFSGILYGISTLLEKE